MAIAELPPAFQTIRLDEAERAAVLRFIAEVAQTAPGVRVVAPRRSSSGRLQLLLDFPDGVDLYPTLKELVGLAHRVKDETGVYLHLD